MQKKDGKRNGVRSGTSQDCVLVFLYQSLKGWHPALIVYMSSINSPVDFSLYDCVKEFSSLNHFQPVRLWFTAALTSPAAVMAHCLTSTGAVMLTLKKTWWSHLKHLNVSKWLTLKHPEVSQRRKRVRCHLFLMSTHTGASLADPILVLGL